jgi:uncharacterized protein YdeI (YjbR/CyaY-like superfamily)
MANSKPKTFSAVLTRGGDSLNWVIIYLPFDSVKLWGSRGQVRVKGDINGFPFRTTLFPTGDGRHMMVVNKAMQKGGNTQAGLRAKFSLEPDLEERVTRIPPELERVLKSSSRLKKFFDSLSASTRKFMIDSVVQAKHAETRVSRAERIAEMLMEVQEAEMELPPVLRQAFARNPEAFAAWQRLSASHRRSHLFGIFHYRTVDGRLRRIEKAMSLILGKNRDEEGVS